MIFGFSHDAFRVKMRNKREVSTFPKANIGCLWCTGGGEGIGLGCLNFELTIETMQTRRDYYRVTLAKRHKLDY